MTTIAALKIAEAAPIRAELAGSSSASALGITAHSSVPVLKLCELLIAAGHDPTLPLAAWRGDVLCLHVASIGAAARLEVSQHGIGFVARRERRPAPPVAQKGSAEARYRPTRDAVS
jgi:hypothetical protein